MKTKDRAILVFAILGILGMGCVCSSMDLKKCPECEAQIVEKIVEKEVESKQCKVSKNNEDVYRQIAELRQEKLDIAQGFMENIDYYTVYPEEISPLIDELEVINLELDIVWGQLQ